MNQGIAPAANVGYGNRTNGNSPAREPMTQLTLTDLQSAIGELQNTVQSLVERLQPICSNYPQDPQKDPGVPEAQLPTIPNAIREAKASIRKQSEILQRLIQTLEI